MLLAYTFHAKTQAHGVEERNVYTQQFRPKHRERCFFRRGGLRMTVLETASEGGRAADDAALKRQVLTADSSLQCLGSRSRFYAEADWLLRLVRRFHQLSNSVEDLLDRVIMCVQLEL